MSNKESTGTALGVLIVNLIVMVPAGLWRAYVAAHLWWWFLVPLGVMEPPSLAVLAGIFVMVSLAAGTFVGPSTIPAENIRDRHDGLVEKMLVGVGWAGLLPLLCLGGGWVWHALAGAGW